MRLQDILVNESTVAGGIATVAMPLGAVQRRSGVGQGVYANSLSKPKKKSKKSLKEANESLDFRIMSMAHDLDDDFGQDPTTIAIIAKELQISPEQVRAALTKTDETLSEGVMDRLKNIYMGLVYDTPMGTPDSEFLAQWQQEIRNELGQNIDINTLAKLKQNFRDRYKTMSSRGDTGDWHREMGMNEQGIQENWIGSPKKWKETVIQTHGPDITFKNYDHLGEPGKRSVLARDANGNTVGVYQRHNKMGTVHSKQGIQEGTKKSNSSMYRRGWNDGIEDELDDQYRSNQEYRRGFEDGLDHAMGPKGLGRSDPKRYKSEQGIQEGVNAKQIKRDLDSGMSYDAVIGKHANKRMTNTDEIRRVIQQHAWEKRMKRPKEPGMAEGWKEKVAGAALGAAALGGIGRAIHDNPNVTIDNVTYSKAISMPDRADARELRIQTDKNGNKIYTFYYPSGNRGYRPYYYPVEQVKEQGVAEGTGVTDYNPKTQGGTRKELLAKYHKTKNPKDAEAARKAGATQKELQGVAEGHADQQRKIFKKNGQAVGEVGIDRESSPGVGQWYMKHYASGTDLSGYDSYNDAVDELKYCMKQGVAEGLPAHIKKSDVPPAMRSRLTMRDVEAERPQGAYRYRVMPSAPGESPKDFLDQAAAQAFARQVGGRVQPLGEMKKKMGVREGIMKTIDAAIRDGLIAGRRPEDIAQELAIPLDWVTDYKFPEHDELPTNMFGTPMFRDTDGMNEGRMKDIDIERQDYERMSPLAFRNRYHMTKQQWFDKYKNFLQPKKQDRGHWDFGHALESKISTKSKVK